MTTTAMTTTKNDLDDYNGDGEEGDEGKTETTKKPKTKTPTMTTQTTTTVAAGVATMDNDHFSANSSDSIPTKLPWIYCHPPSGTKTGKDRYRDCRQHNFSYREYRTLRSPRIYYVFRRCVLVLVGMWVSRVAMFSRRLPPSSVQGNDALHRLLDFSLWGANGDTVNVSMIPQTTRIGGVYFSWLTLKMVNIAEHTNRIWCTLTSLDNSSIRGCSLV